MRMDTLLWLENSTSASMRFMTALLGSTVRPGSCLPFSDESIRGKRDATMMPLHNGGSNWQEAPLSVVRGTELPGERLNLNVAWNIVHATERTALRLPLAMAGMQ